MRYAIFLIFSSCAFAQTWGITPNPGDPYKIGGGASGSTGIYSQTIAAHTPTSITAATHGQGTTFEVDCLTTDTPAIGTSCGNYTVAANGTVAIPDLTYAVKVIILGPVAGGSGVLSFLSNGSSTGPSRGILNFIPGTGITGGPVDNAGATRVDYTPAVDTTVIQSIAQTENGTNTYCADTSGSGNVHACTIPAAISAYATGMVLNYCNVGASATQPTLNVTSGVTVLGAKNIYLSDGVTNPGFALSASPACFILTYDATLNGAAGGFKMQPPAKSRTAAITDLSPVVGDSGLILAISPASAIHLTRLFCAVQGTTNVVVNLDKRTEAAIGTDTGNHLLSADLTAVAGGANTSTFANGAAQCGGTTACAIAAHAPVVMTFTSVSGTPTALNCSLDYVVD